MFSDLVNQAMNSGLSKEDAFAQAQQAVSQAMGEDDKGS